MTHNGHRRIWLDSQIEIPQDCLSARWVTEPQVFEFDATVCYCFNTSLFGIDPGWLLNDSKDKLGSRTGLRNRGKLGQGDTSANRTNEDDVAARVDLLGIQVESLDEHRSDVKDKTDEDESDALRIAKEEARDVRFLDSSFAWDDEELRIAIQDHVNIFGPKCNHSAIVEDNVGEEGVCLLVGVLYCLLVELQLGHAQTTKHHER